MHSHFLAGGAEFLVLQLGGGLLVDPSRVVLHFAVLADQINVGALSAWHKVQLENRWCEIGFKWSRYSELNRGPHPYHGCALPTEL